MPNLAPGELLQALIDSCRKSTDAVLYMGGRNPYRLSLNGKACALFVANISHASRIDPDEYRIQCPGDLPDLLGSRDSLGDRICVLGYHAESGVFSAWDPSIFLARSRMTQRFSLYTRLSGLRRARREKFARYIDAGGQIVLLFRSEYLGLYIQNADILHRASNKALHDIFDIYGSTRVGTAPRRRVTVAKRRIQMTTVQYVRSPQFRQEVLSAYGNRCAMCRVQLELIEAAHLVPHAHPKGLDIVENGVALCALHHKSLDSGLLYIDGDFSINMNDARYRYLLKANLTDGIRRYRRHLRPNIDLPRDSSQHPLRENILLGNQVRGIGID